MKLLMMCVANSARSQLAEALAKTLFSGAEVKSAGSHPGQLNPFAVQVMQEIGIDISAQYSKSIEDLSPQFIVGIDYIITLCAEEVCPTMVAPQAKKLHWPFPDPASKGPLTDAELLQRFRQSRDGIKRRLLEWKKELGV